MTHRWMVAGILVASLAGCARTDDLASSPHVVAHRPPTRKDIIEAVVASQWVALTVHPSCDRAGTEATDSTIGAYLSGFLAELAAGDHRNWLETNMENARSEAGVAVWRSELIVRHSAGDDEWGWGVRFDVRQEDGTVDPKSFSCIGAG